MNLMNHIAAKSVLLLALSFFFVTNTSAALTALNAANANEASTYAVLDQLYGLQNLTRVDDAKATKTDVEWYFGEGKTSADIKTVASYAGYNSTFGISDSLGFTGIVDTQQGDWQTIYSSQFNDDKFHLAIETPEGNIWSSDQGANSDGGTDHMVTWLITGNEGFEENEIGNYIVAFEDLASIISDKDFNDFILEIRGLEDGVAAIPEPATIALLGMGLIGLGYRRRKTRSVT